MFFYFELNRFEEKTILILNVNIFLVTNNLVLIKLNFKKCLKCIQ